MLTKAHTSLLINTSFSLFLITLTFTNTNTNYTHSAVDASEEFAVEFYHGVYRPLHLFFSDCLEFAFTSKKTDRQTQRQLGLPAEREMGGK